MTLERAYAASKSRVQRVPKSLIREFALLFLVVSMRTNQESAVGLLQCGRLSLCGDYSPLGPRNYTKVSKLNTKDVSKGKVMNFVTEYMRKSSGYDIKPTSDIEQIAVFARNEVFVRFELPFMATGDVEQYGDEIVNMSEILAAEIEKALLEKFEMKCAIVQVTDNHHVENPLENESRDTIRVKWL